MSADVVSLLWQAAVISLSGVMAPGAITAATLVAGTKHRHAGSLVAAGHGIVELPLMILIIAGAGPFLGHESVQIGIGLSGGVFLVLLGVQMLIGAGRGGDPTEQVRRGNPVWIGVVLSATNPYFLLWWATIGLALAGDAIELGVVAFVLFAMIHWSLDLIWLEILSLASHKGAQLFSRRRQMVALLICGSVLLVFGVKFLWGAAAAWRGG